MANSNLTRAKAAKNDEFYTRLQDVEKEMLHYRALFNGKKVYMNCDDYRESKFWFYFSELYDVLLLNGLVATCYNEGGRGIKAERLPDGNIVVTELEGDGDFRSQECIDILVDSDMVITNPTFSLLREYIGQLMEHEKEFLIIGNMNAITYKEVFPLIKDDKIWLGVNNGAKEYLQPDMTVKKLGNTCWFTNLQHHIRQRPILLYKDYNEADFPKYDNYDAIEVSRAVDIPRDYDGIMGVPISWLDKYCPEQFEILGLTQRNDDPYKLKQYTKDQYGNANDLNARGVIITNGVPRSMYARILIRHRNPVNNTDNLA